MARYWISWYSGYYADEGCTEPPFQVWVTGSRERRNYGLTAEQYAHYLALDDSNEAAKYLDDHSKDTATICAMVDAESEDEIWQVVTKHFPDQRYRFCELQDDPAAVTGDRFSDFENRTSLYETK